jgi:ABC-2 type transport system ATP-binding protein
MNEVLLHIETENLNKQFRDFWRRPIVHAVVDLNISVARGEVYGLLGPNGSGKSTTIKMLLGLLRPTSGNVKVLGQSPSSVKSKQLIGYLPELSYLHPFLTPRETLHYFGNLFNLGQTECKQRVNELLEMVDLIGAADRMVGSFSKGMARRVGLAQSLINAPRLLILDEPTSGLDPVACREVKDLIRTLANHGVTILMTSHLLADVEDVCDRIAILHKGELQAEGRVGELLSRADIARFTVPGLTHESAKALRDELADKTGAEVSMDNPAMTLEAYFLDVVARAASDKKIITHFKPAPFLLEKINS